MNQAITDEFGISRPFARCAAKHRVPIDVTYLLADAIIHNRVTFSFLKLEKKLTEHYNISSELYNAYLDDVVKIAINIWGHAYIYGDNPHG